MSVGATCLAALVKGGGVATGRQLVTLACFCVLQLGGSQVVNGQAGHTKLGKIAASFINNTVYEQYYYLLCVFFVRVIISKSWAHRPTYWATVPPVNLVGRKLQTL